MAISVGLAIGITSLIVGVTNGVLGVVGRNEARSARESSGQQLDRIEAGIAELTDFRDQFGELILQTQLVPTDTALDRIDAWRRADTEAERSLIGNEIVENAVAGLNGVIRQAQEQVGSANAPGALGLAAALTYATNARLLVASVVEGGAVGQDSVRDDLTAAADLLGRVNGRVIDVLNQSMTSSREQCFLCAEFVNTVRSGIRDLSLTGTTRIDGFLTVATQYDIDRSDAQISGFRTQMFASDYAYLNAIQVVNLASSFRSTARGTEFAGTAGNDLYEDRDDGSLGIDALYGRAGDDTLVGGGQPDALFGGEGDDQLFGGFRGRAGTDADPSDDRLFGEGGNDLLDGEGGNDLLTGGPGDDRLLGGGEVDRAAYAGPPSAYTVVGGVRSATVTGPEGTDTLEGVEQLLFDDVVVDLVNPSPREGSPELIALTYEAAFDRQGEIDIPGLNYWIDVLESGRDMGRIALDFLTAPEFAERFGPHQDKTDEELVELFYRNILDRDGDADGIAFWSDRLADNALDRPGLLVVFADSAENRANAPHIEDLTEVFPGFWDFA